MDCNIEIDHTKPVYLILMDHEELLDQVKSKVIEFGFHKEQIAELEAGKQPNINDYAVRI